MIELRDAQPPDQAPMHELLASAGLPIEGLTDQFPGAYVAAWELARLIGVSGLETYDSVGLLRSVAVLPVYRGQGIGRRLVSDRLQRARGLGLERVFLLTTTAEKYFERLGFRSCERDTAPRELRRAPEFASACPASAACLSLKL